MENRFIQKIPLNPPLPKREDAKKDSIQVPLERLFLTGQAGMTVNVVLLMNSLETMQTLLMFPVRQQG